MREAKSKALPFYKELPEFFARLGSKNRIRKLEPPKGADFCSNDYLGLANHPELIRALKEGLDLYGAGSTASRLVRGHRKVFEELESSFSKWVGSESSLFFSNGYAANVGVISCVADPSYLIFCDRKNHASLMDGVRLSGAQKVYYRHCDLDHLEELLKKHSGHKNKMIVTESVFSMDGDRSDIQGLLSLKDKYGCLLFLDEAHAIGVFGERGEGLVPSVLGKDSENVDFRMATLGKALGLEGALVACSHDVKKYLYHSARTFVFSTAPLPAIAHAGLFSIRLASSMNRERTKIRELSELLRTNLNRSGWNTGNSSSQIIPILQDSEEKALQLANRLEEEGFQAKAIRPPTVDISRLRVSIHSKISKEEVLRFLELVAEN